MVDKKVFYLAILFSAIAILVGSSVYFQEVVDDYIESLGGFERQNPGLAKILFIVLGALSVLLGPFSSFPLLPPAVAIWGLPTTLIMLYASWLAGGAVAYAIGRHLGLLLVYKIIGETKVNRWLAMVESRVNFLILLLFRVATPSETGYIFGIIRYNFWKFMLISALAELPFALILAYASEALLQTGWGVLVGWGWIWAIIMIFALLILKKETRREKLN